MTKELERITNELLSGTAAVLAAKICSGGKDIGTVIEKTYALIRETYLGRRTRGRGDIRPATRARWEEELREAHDLVDKELKQQAFLIIKQRDIARIEYPLLSMKVAEGMKRNKIPYMFKNFIDGNILTVQVTGEYFLNIPLTLENVDKALSLVRYFVDRPDCAQDEIRGIRTYRSPRLAARWKSVATFPGA